MINILILAIFFVNIERNLTIIISDEQSQSVNIQKNTSLEYRE